MTLDVVSLLLVAIAYHGQAASSGTSCDLSSSDSFGSVSNNSHGTQNAVVDVSVSSLGDAVGLASQVVLCPGVHFRVDWLGTIKVDRPFEVWGGGELSITGSGINPSVIEGTGDASLFIVNGSTLNLKSLAATGGGGADGGVVIAREGSSVILSDCAVFGNNVSHNGGAVSLNNSTFVASAVNFTNNTAGVLGGVVHAQATSTVITANGTANFFVANSAKYGGALYMDDASTLSLQPGSNTFMRNSALLRGGAVYATDNSMVEETGTTLFMENTAGADGGAIFAKNGSSVVVLGDTSFADNISQNDGGATMVSDHTSIVTGGETYFEGNHAGNDGGAVQAENGCGVRLAGITAFDNNRASTFGGAINAYSGTTITVEGTTRFSGNVGSFGGAISAETVARVSLAGDLEFGNNTASNDGGALYLIVAAVSIAGSSMFRRNTASAGSGGAMYCSKLAQLRVKNGRFVGNTAAWGGAVATFSSGTGAFSTTSTSNSSTLSFTDADYASDSARRALATSRESSSASTPATSASAPGPSSAASNAIEQAPVRFSYCRFAGNYASGDGGAIYTVAGYDVIRHSNFSQNTAESSGGALVHAGVLQELSDTIFDSNAAGSEGPAIMSLGQLRGMQDVTFVRNTFFCPADHFSTETVTEEDNCRFMRVCAQCASDCASEIVAGAKVANAALSPICEPVPKGSSAPSAGVKLSTLEVDPGWYRETTSSTDIRKCHHRPACEGGVDVEHYCARGYSGPYCAVCENTYVPGYAYTCTSCTGSRRERAVGIVTAVAFVIVVFAAFVVSRLVSLVEPEREPSREETKFSNVAVVTYPGVYGTFLSAIDLANLDVGYIVSFACIHATSFYDRLLIATLGPLVVLSLLVCTYAVAIRRNRTNAHAVATVRRRHLSVALFVVFIVYGTVSHIIFETFVCDALDGGSSYLRADYSLECHTSSHTSFRIYAGVMAAVYPVGVPCAFGWWLFKHRHGLRQQERAGKAELMLMADLWGPYKRDKYYYEVVECFRRISLTGVTVFVEPESAAQIATVLLLAAVFMIISEILLPFACTVEMWLYRAGHYVVFASMYLALLLRVDVSKEPGRDREVLSIVIVIAHAAMILTVIAQGLRVWFEWDELAEAPQATKGLDRIAATNAGPGAASGEDAGVPSRNRSDLAPPAAATSALLRNMSEGKEDDETEGHGRARSLWETWERVAPTAKSSFFPSPSQSSRRQVLRRSRSPRIVPGSERAGVTAPRPHTDRASWPTVSRVEDSRNESKNASPTDGARRSLGLLSVLQHMDPVARTGGANGGSDSPAAPPLHRPGVERSGDTEHATLSAPAFDSGGRRIKKREWNVPADRLGARTVRSASSGHDPCSVRKAEAAAGGAAIATEEAARGIRRSAAITTRAKAPQAAAAQSPLSVQRRVWTPSTRAASSGDDPLVFRSAASNAAADTVPAASDARSLRAARGLVTRGSPVNASSCDALPRNASSQTASRDPRRPTERGIAALMSRSQQAAPKRPAPA